MQPHSIQTNTSDQKHNSTPFFVGAGFFVIIALAILACFALLNPVSLPAITIPAISAAILIPAALGIGAMILGAVGLYKRKQANEDANLANLNDINTSHHLLRIHSNSPLYVPKLDVPKLSLTDIQRQEDRLNNQIKTQSPPAEEYYNGNLRKTTENHGTSSSVGSCIS